MDRQWRPGPNPRPIQANVCPTCLIPHFPFCPPPPPSSYYHHPPLPPFQGDHSFPPPYAPRNPNWPPYEHPDGDRNFKRPRIDDSISHDKNTPFSNFSEDERRLKLVRDHGVALASQQQQPEELHQSNYVRQQQQQQHKQVNQNGFSHLQNGQFSSSYHYHAHTLPQPTNGPNNMMPQPHDFRPHEVNFEGNHEQLNGRAVHYPYPYPSENVAHMEASRFFRGQPPPPAPPLPSSPPPPLPVDPPINQSSQLNAYFSPPKKPASLFPVPVSSSALVAPSSYSQVSEAHAYPLPQPYFQSKPLPEYSIGFPPEVRFMVVVCLVLLLLDL